METTKLNAYERLLLSLKATKPAEEVENTVTNEGIEKRIRSSPEPQEGDTESSGEEDISEGEDETELAEEEDGEGSDQEDANGGMVPSIFRQHFFEVVSNVFFEQEVRVKRLIAF